MWNVKWRQRPDCEVLRHEVSCYISQALLGNSICVHSLLFILSVASREVKFKFYMEEFMPDIQTVIYLNY